MNSQTEIVFIHRGRSIYLPYVLAQARHVCPDSKITLLGDAAAIEQSSHVPGVAGRNLAELESEDSREFQRLYRHMSTNSAEFELFCWLRWFALQAYTQQSESPLFLHLDSDVLLYTSPEQLALLYRHEIKSGGFLIKEQDHGSYFWAASAHLSYWSRELLDSFCQLCIESYQKPALLAQYQEKFNWHQRSQASGGVCDMTSLYLFWRANEDRIQNLARVYQGNVFDNNFNLSDNFISDEYQLAAHKRYKKIEMRQGQPWLFPKSGDPVQVHGIHFQGIAKKHLRRFYTGPQTTGMSIRFVRDKLQGKLQKLFRSGKKS